jgi:hypothetical protein
MRGDPIVQNPFTINVTSWTTSNATTSQDWYWSYGDNGTTAAVPTTTKWLKAPAVVKVSLPVPTIQNPPPAIVTPPAAFNPYVNASDLMAKFVEYCGSRGLKQHEVLGVPVQAFIHWLIHEAAKHDGQPNAAEGVPPVLAAHNRCRRCGRFLSAPARQQRIEFCSPGHAQEFVYRQLAA